MNEVLTKRKSEIAAAMHGLCAACSNLAQVRRDLEQASPDGKGENGLLAMQVRRIQGHLMSAALDIPDAMWLIMLDAEHIGGAELQARVQALIGMRPAKGVAP